MNEIQILNLKHEKPVHPWDFRVDRGTPVGNLFPMKVEGRRDMVCEMYEDWFRAVPSLGNQRTDFLYQLLAAYRKHGKLRLFCWCAPKRCHAETIKRWLEEQVDG